MHIYIYICVIWCISLSYSVDVIVFFFLIVLPRFGHVSSNKGRFGHKRKLPGFFYNLTSRLLPADQWHVCESGARDVAIVKKKHIYISLYILVISRLHSWSSTNYRKHSTLWSFSIPRSLVHTNQTCPTTKWAKQSRKDERGWSTSINKINHDLNRSSPTILWSTKQNPYDFMEKIL